MKYLSIIFLFLMPLCVTKAQQNGDNVIFIETQLSPERALGTITQILHTEDYSIDTLHDVMLYLETRPKKVVHWLNVFNLSISVSIMYDERIKLEGKWLEASVFGGERGRTMQPLIYNKKGLEAKVWQEMEKIAQTYVAQNDGKISYGRENLPE